MFYDNQFDSLKWKIYKYSPQLYFDNNTLIEFKDYDYYIKSK